jgi:lysophospholipase L1-like esterase
MSGGLRISGWVAALVTLGVGCGDGAGGGNASTPPGAAGGWASASGGSDAIGSGGEGLVAIGGATGLGGGAVGGAGGSPTLPVGLEEVGSLVVLGDSIGDGGGQSPYYYQLLREDLEAAYGPIEYVRAADSGSETGALVGQVSSLPSSLPGPVVVTITSGGNDMKAELLPIVLGQDGPAKAEMGQHIDAALDALLAPGRFGPGVSVHVFEGNIYDASDGAGDYAEHDCAFGQGYPAMPVDPYFEAWNAVIEEQVTAHDQTYADMHGYFYGHGYSGSPSWYASDCTHPNSLGHAALAGLFFHLISGEPLP